MAGKIMLTGDRPTGKLHIGHYVGSLKQRLEIQKDPEFDKMFIMIADAQALTDNAENPQKVRESVMQVAMDYLAIGIDPSKTSAPRADHVLHEPGYRVPRAAEPDHQIRNSNERFWG